MVAKEIKRDKREDLFAATPPLEANKVLFSLFTSMPEICLDFIDVVRAYFHAKASRDVCVELPKEDHHEEMCGKLKGDVRHQGCSQKFGPGVHRDDGRGWIHTGIITCVRILPQREKY